jgi:hypothetical protein
MGQSTRTSQNDSWVPRHFRHVSSTQTVPTCPHHRQFGVPTVGFPIHRRMLVALLLGVLGTASGDTNPFSYTASRAGTVSGTLRQWETITLALRGPPNSNNDSSASSNPRMDNRLDVTWAPEGSRSSLTVPGYLATTSTSTSSNTTNNSTTTNPETDGSVWLVHVTLESAGTWHWEASFRTGPNVAIRSMDNTDANIDTDTDTSTSGWGDRITGSIVVAQSAHEDEFASESAPGETFWELGKLEYVGAHHALFARGHGRWFLQSGVDLGSTLLRWLDYGTDDYPTESSTTTTSLPPGSAWLTRHQASFPVSHHAPSWTHEMGNQAMGLLEYLARHGVNAIRLNVWDDTDASTSHQFLFAADQDPNSIRVSQLARWQVALEYAQRLGLALQIQLHGSDGPENESPDVTTEQRRKLYYRELVARYGHHLALSWHLGPAGPTSESRANDLRSIDAYQHTIVVDSTTTERDLPTRNLLGVDTVDSVVVPTPTRSLALTNTVVRDVTTWRDLSRARKHHWIVHTQHAYTPSASLPPQVRLRDDDEYVQNIRRNVVWGNLLAGGAGVEYGLREAIAVNGADMLVDLERIWLYTRLALDFLQNLTPRIPFWYMVNENFRVASSTAGALCLAQPRGDVMVLYFPKGGTARVHLPKGDDGTSYTIQWYDPRVGGELQTGSIASVQTVASTKVSLGTAPSVPHQDWVVLLRRVVAPIPVTPKTRNGPRPWWGVGMTLGTALVLLLTGVFVLYRYYGPSGRQRRGRWNTDAWYAPRSGRGRVSALSRRRGTTTRSNTSGSNSSANVNVSAHTFVPRTYDSHLRHGPPGRAGHGHSLV